MKKKNQMTRTEAAEIYKRLKKSACPSDEVKEYVHNILLSKHHFLFQYKQGNNRFGYCTYCKEDFPLELKLKRTFTDNDIDVLSAKHNERVICPCCGREVTKRYAGYPQKNVYADVAELKADESGGLVVYVYRFAYNYKEDFRVKNPWSSCYNIGYFDINRYFHTLNGWGGSTVYLEDKYTSHFLFSTACVIDNPFILNQPEVEGIKLFKPEDGINRSNLKYSCLLSYLDDGAVDMFRYLKFYCAYPEIAEKLVKEGFGDILRSYLSGRSKGLFNFSGKTTADFFRLNKEYLNVFKAYRENHGNADLKAMHFMQKHKIKPEPGNLEFILNNTSYLELIEILLGFIGIVKARGYVKKQGLLCSCRNAYVTAEHSFFISYRDYIAQCERLGYDLADKNIVLPMNLFQSHQQLTDLIDRQEMQKRIRKNAEAMKKFKSRLKKLQKKYTFSVGDFLIRPAESVKELYIEGSTLHHCVYSNYTERYLNGKTDILFIRRRSEPDKPFYTLEYKNNSVIQCRTAHNAGATDEVNAFIEKWKSFLKQNNKKKRDVA